MRIMRKVLRLCVAALALGVAGGGIAPVAAQGVSLTTTDPNPAIGDGIRLETDVLKLPPYNRGGYEVRYWFCRGTAETCRDKARWRFMPETNAQGDQASKLAFVCRSGPCSQRVRIKNEADFFFIATVMHNGKRLVRSAPLKVSWTKQDAPKQPLTRRVDFLLTLTVGGVSCTAKLGEQVSKGARPTVETDKCSIASPDSLVVEINSDGSTAPVTAVAKTTGYDPEKFDLSISWGSGPDQRKDCGKTDTCTATIPFSKQVESVDRSFIVATLVGDASKGPQSRHKPDGSGTENLRSLQALVWVSFKKK